jgi:transposase-like protein
VDKQIENAELPKQQDKAILALISEGTVERAAKKVGVSERTLYRWLKEPEFKRAYQEFKRESFGQAIGLLQRYSSTCVNVLAKIATDSASPPQARVSAATNMLRIARDAIELDDLCGRVDALEQAAKAQEKDKSKWRS